MRRPEPNAPVQVFIVAGGASGIGLALGTARVKRGWHVVLADLQDVAAKEHADPLPTSQFRFGSRSTPRSAGWWT